MLCAVQKEECAWMRVWLCVLQEKKKLRKLGLLQKMKFVECLQVNKYLLLLEVPPHVILFFFSPIE